MMGLMIAPIRLGMVVTINPSSQFGAWSVLSFKGRMLGTTSSINEKQKSPHNKNRKSVIRPALL